MGKNIPERVAIAIQKSDLDDDEIADRTGKSQSTVNRWRNKKITNYSKNALHDIANALNVRYEWLRFGKGKMKNGRTEEPKSNYSADQLVAEAKRRIRNGEAPENAEDLLLQAVLDVLSDLKLSVEKLVRLRQDHSDE